MMKAFVKTALLGSLLFLGSQGAKAQVSVGIEIGAPPLLASLPSGQLPRGRTSFGSMATGIPQMATTIGIPATGPVRPMQALIGWRHIMTATATSAATGMATMAVSNTTTSGTTITIVTTAAITISALGIRLLNRCGGGWNSPSLHSLPRNSLNRAASSAIDVISFRG